MLQGLPHEGEFCFVSLRGEHWTPSSRAYHWKAVRAAAGWEGSLYLATRHFAGWYMVNELEMSSEDVAIALGHQDGGNLVRRLYGHRDKGRALDRIVGAYADAASDRTAGVEARDQWWDRSLDPARLFDPGEPVQRFPYEDSTERLR